jgi:hypothetical protein
MRGLMAKQKNLLLVVVKYWKPDSF